jgi:hypothetical protein
MKQHLLFLLQIALLSRKPGDWGGIVILGDALLIKLAVSLFCFNLNPEVSYYGGANEEDNSGILKFVRIEYSGRKLKEQKELNGLSLAGVGIKPHLKIFKLVF